MIGLVGRCDGGGLASITAEIHRHLKPERTLLLDLEEHGRGVCIPDDYQHGVVYRTSWKGALSETAIDWFAAEGIDVAFSAEVFYDDRLVRRLHQAGVRTVLYAMPELAAWSIAPRVVAVPTTWRADQIANAVLLPMPVARDRLPFTERKQVAHLYHVGGAAMLDRNGTDLLCAALPFVTRPVRVTIRSERPVNVPRCQLDVTVVSDRCDDYWDGYPPDADLLVLPRRYGGLSLVVQEAASLGMPALMLQSDPYAPEPFVHTIPSTGSRLATMKGGQVPVNDASPVALASALDWLFDHPEVVAESSRAADGWAAEHDWTGDLGRRWASILGADA